MFHQGDLQSGISLAIQENKCVACFVVDDSPESADWESSRLQGEETSHLLRAKAVVLRIPAGSQEAGFLSAFCPVEDAPALVLIRAGRLLDVIKRNTERTEWEDRVTAALGGETTVQKPPPSDGGKSSEAITGTPSNTQPQHTPSVLSEASNTKPQHTPSGVPEAPGEEQEAQLKSKGKQKDTGSAHPIDAPAPALKSAEKDPAKATRNTWLEEQKQRQADARRDRERILLQIEADKAERRAKREAEKRARDAAVASTPPASSALPRKAANSTTSNLQVRLLDGSQIRRSFPATATLDSDVRSWIDTHLSTRAPYTLKHLLPPSPARTISVSEESQPLADLGLLPSATLVLQPIAHYADAYDASPPGLLSLPHSLVTGLWEYASSSARWLRGGPFSAPPEIDHRGGQLLGSEGAPPSPPPAQQPQGHEQRRPQPSSATPSTSATPARGAGARIRTLADQRDGAADPQFYNGNGSDFLPNAEDASSAHGG